MWVYTSGEYANLRLQSALGYSIFGATSGWVTPPPSRK